MGNPASPFLLLPRDLTGQELDQIGGKALNLWRLSSLPFHIPAWCVIPVAIGRDGGETAARAAAEAALRHLGASAWFAVRSSAVAEDGDRHAFAGQFTSRLFVAPEALPDAIREVWASARSSQVQAYCRQHQLRCRTAWR